MTQPIFEKLAIPEGSWVLVTGVNGYVASHIANYLLHHGYNVRGTVRDFSKNQWIKELFAAKFKNCTFELIEVKDATRFSAFDDAIRGVSGVVHVATIFGDAQEMIEKVIEMNRSLLITASQEPSVKRFVYTSSSEAAVFSSFLEHDENQQTKITSSTWNDIAVERVRNKASPATPKGGFDIYAASKTLGERAIWEWVEESQPGFVVNTVLPSVCFGASMEVEKQGHASSSSWPAAIFRNEFHKVWPLLKHIIPTGAYFANVEDVALLHLAGLANDGVQGERLFSFGKPFTWKQITRIFQNNFPDREFTNETMTHEGWTGSLDIEPADRAEQLLRSMGKPGWATLEDTLKANIEDLM